MSNYYGNLPPQYNNRHINNSLINGYQQALKKSVPFGNNQMLNNNPTYFQNINDVSFYHKMNMEKMDKMRKIKNIDELGISKDKLVDFIICPIKVEKENSKELTKKYNDKSITYVNPKKKNTVTEAIKALWSGRQNDAYKNILKNACVLEDKDYKKKFKSKNDLVVHKVTLLDKNLIKTLAQFEEMIDFIEIHNGALKVKYSEKKYDKYHQKFDYENKIKYRVKYDPKNYNELKKFYKKEQKKIKKSNKRVDEMIEMLLMSENYTKEELDEIKNLDNDEDDTHITMSFEKSDIHFEKQLEEELQAELEKEFGKENLDDILEEYIGKEKSSKNKSLKLLKSTDTHEKSKHKKNINSVEEKLIVKETITDEKIQKSKPILTVKSKKQPVLETKSLSVENDQTPSSTNTTNTTKRITVKSKKQPALKETNDTNETTIGKVDQDELEELRKQKKSKNQK